MTRLALLLVLVAGCSSPVPTSETTPPANDPTTTPATTMPATTTPATTMPVTPTAIDTGDLGQASVDSVSVDGRRLAVAVAATAEDRSQGLRGVTDLGDLAGMLFTWGGEEVSSRFTMADTVIGLDIAFFDADGQFVDGFTMLPCDETPCPSYAASGQYAYALESPAGSLIDIGPGSVLVVEG